MLFDVVLITSCGLLFGYDIGVMSGAADHIPYIESTQQKENIVSFVILGGMFASIFAGHILEKFSYNRPAVIRNCHLFCFINIAVFAGDPFKNYYLGLITRFLIGFFIALNLIATTTFISDTVPSSKKGFYVSLNESGITLGILLAYLVNYSLTSNWRAIVSLMALFNVSGMVSLNYKLKGQVKIQQTELEETLGTESNLTINSITNNNDTDKRCNSLINLHVKGPFPTKRFLLGVYLVFATQLSGQPNFMYYAKNIVLDHSDSTVILFGVVKFLSTFICSFTVDRFGRKVLLNIGCFIQFLNLLMIAGVASQARSLTSSITLVAGLDPVTTASRSILAHPSLLKLYFSGYALGFSISFGPLLWILLSEIFPKPWSPALFGYCQTINYLLNFSISNKFLQLTENFGIDKLLYFHSFCCLMAIFVNYFCIPGREEYLHSMQVNTLRLHTVGSIDRDVNHSSEISRSRESSSMAGIASVGRRSRTIAIQMKSTHFNNLEGTESLLVSESDGEEDDGEKSREF